MGRNIKLTLSWKGPWTLVDVKKKRNLPGPSGIYLIIAGKQTEGKWDPRSYSLLDIGQAEDMNERIAHHDREDCWEQHAPSGSTILVKSANIPKSEYDEIDRRTVECCLRAHEKPMCGTECNEGYNRDDVVSISNSGSYRPLKSKYACD